MFEEKRTIEHKDHLIAITDITPLILTLEEYKKRGDGASNPIYAREGETKAVLEVFFPWAELKGASIKVIRGVADRLVATELSHDSWSRDDEVVEGAERAEFAYRFYERIVALNIAPTGIGYKTASEMSKAYLRFMIKNNSLSLAKKISHLVDHVGLQLNIDDLARALK